MLIDQIAAEPIPENFAAVSYEKRRRLQDKFYRRTPVQKTDIPQLEYAPNNIAAPVIGSTDFIGPVPPKERDFLYVGSQRVLPDWAKVKSHVPHLKKILKECAEKHGVSINDMISKRRKKEINIARREYFYRARTETSASFPAIGRACGGKDHTTAMHGYNKQKAILKGGEV